MSKSNRADGSKHSVESLVGEEVSHDSALPQLEPGRRAAGLALERDRRAAVPASTAGDRPDIGRTSGAPIEHEQHVMVAAGAIAGANPSTTPAASAPSAPTAAPAGVLKR